MGRRLRELLGTTTLDLVAEHRSVDGSSKLVWGLSDGLRIESVLIPDDDRLTLCVSTQVGCAMACSFCLTGDMGLVRQLSAEEIVLQPALLAADGRRPTNLVMMGMGEPLHNFENLDRALTMLLADTGLGFSHRRITVSTVGLVPALRRLVTRHPVNVAVSLNATTDAQRSTIMPINDRYDIAELMAACRELPIANRKRIVFEYVMIDGLNATPADARRLVQLLGDMAAKVNLIPYNENPGRNLRRPSEAVVDEFRTVLAAAGVHCSVRRTRGRDIAAACGQLGSAPPTP